MGGNAFKLLLPKATFPRMHPTVYNALKSQLLPIVRPFYAHVTVSPECPGKADHGDLDIVVAVPCGRFTHDELKAALRATCSIPMDGSRTSNFAIPEDAFAEVVRTRKAVLTTPENHCFEGPADAEPFIQVDVNVCTDHPQWERTVFYTSYGDLGYIIGLLAQTAGLSFNIFGLKLAEPVPTSPAQTFYLSSSMSDIVAFFGLSMDQWSRGFESQDEIFAWIATSPFVLPLADRFRSADFAASSKERTCKRPMRGNFVAYLQMHDLPESVESSQSLYATLGRREEKIDAALRHFGKDREHAALLHLTRAQQRAKEILNGKNVQEWTGVLGMPVRFVMDEVKERLPSLIPDSGVKPAIADIPEWQRALLDMEDEDVRALVVTVKEELQADGRLEFDWRHARAAKLERERQQKSGSGNASVELEKR